MSALSGHGWVLPDQGLSRYPLPEWDRRIRAAAQILEHGGTDREAMRSFDDIARAKHEAEAAISFNEYRTRLRRQARKGRT